MGILLNDILFKLVFGGKGSEPVLRALLNALLGLSGGQKIVELKILTPNLTREHLLDKGAILDVKAQDATGRYYNVEVQMSSKPAYKERALYYLARLFGSQLEPGQGYTKLAKTIGISLVDFNLFREQEDLHSVFKMVDPTHQTLLTDVFELHFIELPKFRVDKPHSLRTPFEKWLHVLKFGELYDREELPDILTEEEGIEMALESMRQARASDEYRELLELRKKAAHDRATELEVAREEGRDEGREAGREEGREAGREEGREEGREAAHKETARRMKADGFDSESILRFTGIHPDDLE